MKCIGIVSEDKGIVETFKVILKDYLVEEIKPSELIEKLNEIVPFLIFVDTYINETDPVELVEKVSTEKPNVLIVPLISSYDKISRELLEKNIFDIIEKPFLIEKVFYIVKKAESWMKLRLENINSTKECIKIFDKKEQEKVELKNNFFQGIFQCIAENFLDLQKVCFEITKILRYFFHFSSITIFLKKGEKFINYSSLGVDENLCKKIELEYDSAIIKWFLKEGKIIDLRKINFSLEIRSLANLLKAILIFPIKTFNGKFLGFLTVGEKSINEDITNEELTTIVSLCDYLSIVFDNLFLYSEITWQKKYHEFLLENLPLGIIGVDKDGKINMLNKNGEKILKVQYEEIRGKNIEKVGSQIADFIRRALLYKEKIYRTEIFYIPSKLILGLSTSVIEDDFGNIIGAVMIFQDITSIKEVERREKEIEKNKYWTYISSRLAHELKNPLVAINTFAQMLPSAYEDKEFRENFSRVVIEEIKKINEIINMINKIGEEIEIKEEKINFIEFIEEFIRVKGIQRGSFWDVNFSIKGDLIKLKEAFDNIISFIKENSDEKEIFLEVMKKDKKNLNIIFRLKGENILSLNEEEIFSPLNSKLKFDSIVKMLIARKIIGKHQGELKFEREREGQTLVVVLPIKNEQDFNN